MNNSNEKQYVYRFVDGNFRQRFMGRDVPCSRTCFSIFSPFYFTIIRYIPVAVILVMLLYFIEGKRSFKTDGNGFRLWFFGTMGFTVYNLFIFWGQNLLGGPGVLLASIMEALAPIVSILIVWFVKKTGRTPLRCFASSPRSSACCSS